VEITEAFLLSATSVGKDGSGEGVETCTASIQTQRPSKTRSERIKAGNIKCQELLWWVYYVIKLVLGVTRRNDDDGDGDERSGWGSSIKALCILINRPKGINYFTKRSNPKRLVLLLWTIGAIRIYHTVLVLLRPTVPKSKRVLVNMQGFGRYRPRNRRLSHRTMKYAISDGSPPFTAPHSTCSAGKFVPSPRDPP
jgi:hypothetical protein